MPEIPTPEKTTIEDLQHKIAALEKQITKHQRSRKFSQAAIRRHRRFLRFLPYPVASRNTKGLITYLNPAFTRTFGWSLKELRGRRGTQYVPKPLRNELFEVINASPEKSIFQYESKRLTKDGRTLDVVVRVGIDRDPQNHRGDTIVMLKDVTMEKRINRTQSAMNRIAKALPQYPDLKKLLFYINHEIKMLIGTENATTLLLTRDKKELYFMSATHDNLTARAHLESTRFPVEELFAGKVLKTGIAIMLNNINPNSAIHKTRDLKLGYTVKNLLLVPLRIQDKIVGILATDNKKTGNFDETDLETLQTLASTVALSIENARVTNRLKIAYEELKSLNKAKDKMISHLSHELRTPVAVLLTSIKTLGKRLEALPDKSWQPSVERIQRNLERILGIEDEVSDILEKKDIHHLNILSFILDQCQDELDALIEEETGDSAVLEKVRQKIEDIFSPRDLEVQTIQLDAFAAQRIDAIKPLMAHRTVELEAHLSPCPPIRMPEVPLRKTIDGLIRNAVENTPDTGRVEVHVSGNNKGVTLMVKDYGIGLTEEAQKRIFEGFFATQDTLKYSSKRPFDFNAGGKGADLLRMKIFSERYNFKISMTSQRCQRLPETGDICPGSIEACNSMDKGPCNGTTTVTCFFPLQAAQEPV